MDEPKMTREQLDSFRDYALKRVGTPSLSIGQCFRDWLQSSRVFAGRPNLRDRLTASGVLGCGSIEHPSDLSTDPKHREGFGECDRDRAEN